MGFAIGLIIILGCVFGTYVAVGGKVGIILYALPGELTMILGAATGGYIMGNKGNVIKKTGKALKKAIVGPGWKKADYKDLLLLLFTLCKLMRTKGMIAVEAHVENPNESTIFSQYPRIAHDHAAMDLICDTLRNMTMGMENPYAVEDLMEKQIDKHHHEELAPAEALQGMADALPAIGIVAAVLGIIKTMASISEPAEVLGKMIGGALVGTFLGVFLAYLLVGPLSSKATQSINEEGQFYFIIRDVLVGHLKGLAPQLSMEIGRGNIPTIYQPSFAEMEEAAGEVKLEG